MTYRLFRTVAGIALAAASLLAAPAMPAAASTRTAVCAPGAVYAVGDDGSLNWWGDADPAATGGFSARRSVGNGWADFSQITAGGGGVIYAVDGDVLRWYRHTDPVGGSASWAAGSGKVIGQSGWRSVSYVLSAGNGVLLTINRDDHNMRWYRYSDPVGGNGSWVSGSGKTIGYNWDFTNVFSGGAGIVYAVTDKGALLWYRYSDPYNGNGGWNSSSIGQGWGFSSYLPEGGGVIYGIRPTGQLGSYQHTDPYSGAATWITYPDYGGGWTTYTHHAPPTSDTSTCGPSAMAASAVYTALAQVGKPYEWGAEGPDTFDCSGLTQYAYKSVGVSLNRVTYDQWAQFPRIQTSLDLAGLVPGDLVYFDGLDHMAMYIGNNRMVEAPHTGVNVRIATLSSRTGYEGANRPAPSR